MRPSIDLIKLATKNQATIRKGLKELQEQEDNYSPFHRWPAEIKLPPHAKQAFDEVDAYIESRHA